MQKIDSIKLTTNTTLNKLNSQYDSIGQAYIGIAKRLQQKIDSLQHLGQPADDLIHKTDSLTAVKEEKLYALKSKSEKLKNEVREKLNSLNLPPELSGKTTEYTSALDHVDVSLPGTAFAIPELNVPELKGLNLSSPKIPELNLDGLSKIKDLASQVEELKDGLPEMKLPEKEKMAAKVEEEASAFASDRLGEMPGIPELPQSGEEAQQQVLNEMKEQAMDYFGGKQEILKKSMEQVSEYKQKFPDVQSLGDLPKKAPDPIKKKAFVERLVPGLTLQYQRWNEHFLDMNLYTGYRFTSKLTAGAGWNQRVAFDADLNQWNQLSYLYGPRVYSSYNLGRGFIAHIEGETMRTFIHYSLTDPQAGQWEWVCSMMTGLKKEYRLTKKLKGTAYLLYNIFDPNHKSPYVDRLNARFGVEYRIRKKPIQQREK
ncbi:MAG: hypothetical protein HRU69_07290 [Flammeovirgaceae bacterium]|nr:MAG: hypothetical protein HRU69_07290 [Flammeovirgaceae bacterium]